MKPKDLKNPYLWKERRPCLDQGVFYVQNYYFKHDKEAFPTLDHPEIYIEYCSGNGDWIVSQAQNNPHQYWIAVEKRFDRVRKIWSKRENSKLSNLLIVAGEAYTFCQYYLPPSLFSGIYINFPDPWPKAKHAKHRLFHPDFVEQLARTSKKDAELLMVSDDPLWVERTTTVIEENPLFTGPFLQKTHPKYETTSFFHKLWLSKGKIIHYLGFKRV